MKNPLKRKRVHDDFITAISYAEFMRSFLAAMMLIALVSFAVLGVFALAASDYLVTGIAFACAFGASYLMHKLL